MGILALGITSTDLPRSSLLQSLVTSLLCPVSGMMVAVKLEGTHGFSLSLRAVELPLEETQLTLSSLGRPQSIVIGMFEMCPAKHTALEPSNDE